jgi:hypothetical protein
LSKSETEGGDLFSYPQVTVGQNARHPLPGVDQRHQIVGNFITDIPYAWGIQFSGFLTVGSGIAYQRNQLVFASATDSTLANIVQTPGRTAWQKTLDLRFRKDFLALRGNNVGVTASVFNVFNWQNLGGYNGYFGSPGNPNPDLGKASSVNTDPRRFQIGVQYDFK